MADALTDELSIAAFFSENSRHIAVVQNDADQLLMAYANLEQKSGKLYPVEERAYQQHSTTLSKQIDAILPIINTGILDLRDDEDRPRITLFPLTAAELTIRVRFIRSYQGTRRVTTISPSIPHELEIFFQPLIERLFTWLSGLDEDKNWHMVTEGISIKSTFSGLLPKATRARIRHAVSYFGEANVLLVAEVTTWYKGKEKWQINKPPLTVIVAGWDGKQLRMIDSFQPIPYATVAAGKFTV